MTSTEPIGAATKRDHAENGHEAVNTIKKQKLEGGEKAEPRDPGKND